MCRHVVVCVGAALAVAWLSGSGSLTAQEPLPATAEELRAELELLEPRLEAGRAAKQRRREETPALEPARSPEPTPPAAPPLMLLPEALWRWLGGRGQINRVVPPGDLYRQLVLEPSAAHRRCASGDVDACAAALGLDSGEGRPRPRQWYDPAIANRVVWERANGTAEWDRGDVQACLRRQDDACLQVLDRWGFTRAAPVTMAARASLTRHALATGGDGARDRMAALGPEATAAQLLAAAAGRPVQVLAAEWTVSLRDAHPRHGSSQERRDRSTALAWASLFAFLAMTNTRWRMGR